VSLTGSPEDFFVIASTSDLESSVHASRGTNGVFGGACVAVLAVDAGEGAAPEGSVFSAELQSARKRKMLMLTKRTKTRDESMSTSFVFGLLALIEAAGKAAAIVVIRGYFLTAKTSPDDQAHAWQAEPG